MHLAHFYYKNRRLDVYGQNAECSDVKNETIKHSPESTKISVCFDINTQVPNDISISQTQNGNYPVV